MTTSLPPGRWPSPAQFDELLDRTSLSGADTESLQRRTPAGVARAIVDRADAIVAGCSAIGRPVELDQASSAWLRPKPLGGRRFLTYAASLLFGSPLWQEAFVPFLALAEYDGPLRYGMEGDEAAPEYGAVLARLSAARELPAQADAVARKHQYRMLADLCVLAGQTAFEAGLAELVLTHYGDALTLAHLGRSPFRTVKALYQAGRIWLECDEPSQALKLFQLGQIAAQDAEFDLLISILCANEAWAYAKIGDTEQCVKMIKRAQEQYPPWLDRHTLTIFDAALADTPQPLSNELVAEQPGADEETLRHRVLNLLAMATALLLAGQVDAGVTAGQHALELAVEPDSDAVHSQIVQLKVAIDEGSPDPMVQDLSARIETRLRMAG